MAIPSAPTNVIVQTGNGSNFISWDQTTTAATSFLIQRSLDNITFTALVTVSGSPLNNFYTDAAVTAGTQYWYQVAAQNGSGPSAYAVATNGSSSGISGIVPAAVGQVSLQWVRLMAQLRADLFNSQFISLAEWNSYISNSYKDLYNLLVQKFGDEYFSSSTYTWTLSGSNQLYPLPNDFYKATLIEISLNPADPNSWITLKKYMKRQQNLYNYPNVFTMYAVTNVRYRFTGNFIQLVPIPQSGFTLRMWYAPRPQILYADTDLLDGIAGYEDMIILSAARKALLKQEQDVAELDAEIQYLYQRIDEAAGNRDIGEPERVSDSRTINFAWGGDDDGSYGYGAGGGG